MRILSAYDGSESADQGIDDLQRAALPTKADALVVSVAEVWLPPPAHNEVLDDMFPLQIPPGLKHARERAAHMIRMRRKWLSVEESEYSRLFPNGALLMKLRAGRLHMRF